MAQRDELPDTRGVVRIFAIMAFCFVVFLDSQPNVDINFFVYCIIGGSILGVSDLTKLLSGISFNGNNKKD